MVSVSLIQFALDTAAEMLLFHNTSNRKAICKVYGQQSLNLFHEYVTVCHDICTIFLLFTKTPLVSLLVQLVQFCFVLYTHTFKVHMQNFPPRGQ
jgi:hypothetical protein